MKQYLENGLQILEEGFEHPDRTGNGRITKFGMMMRFPLKEGFPLVTTKKMFTKGMIEEVLWILRGSTDVEELIEKNVHIWDDWRVKPEDIDSFIQKLKDTQKAQGFEPMSEEDEAQLREQLRSQLGGIGNLYGAAWRRAPNSSSTPSNPFATGKQLYDKMLSDDQTLLKDLLTQYGKTPETADEAMMQNAVQSVQACGIDQLAYVIDLLKNDPYSSRILISAWVPEWVPFSGLSPEHNALLGKGALAACHCTVQFSVKDMYEWERKEWLKEHKPEVYAARGEGFDLDAAGVPKHKLSCLLFQRSADWCLGVPFNISSYALLTMMIAQCVGMDYDEFIWSGGDCHLYPQHADKFANVQAIREPHKLPKMNINPDVKDILGFKLEDFTLEGYEHDEAIKYDIAV